MFTGGVYINISAFVCSFVWCVVAWFVMVWRQGVWCSVKRFAHVSVSGNVLK